MGVGPVMKQGKITVTAAEATGGKNVDCGFIPSYVKIWNEDATLEEDAILEKFGGMERDQSLATKIIKANGTNDILNLNNETTNGLKPFDDGSVAQVETDLTGTTFTKTEGSTTLTASGGSPAFLTEVNIGDRVRVGNELLEVESITSDTVLITTSAWQTSLAATEATVVVPGAEVSQSGFKGFSIPAAFMDSGDVLWFIAFGNQFGEV